MNNIKNLIKVSIIIHAICLMNADELKGEIPCNFCYTIFGLERYNLHDI